MSLSQKERQQINTLVARFESDTGIQAVAAVTGKADAYPEIPWKAYAMGSALGAVVASVHAYFTSDWSIERIVAVETLIILGAGAMLALLAALVPAVGRLFLDRVRAREEALQYAQQLFLERELFRTASRRAVLIVMCRFERIAVALTDTGLAQHAPPAELNDIGRAAGALLAKGGLVAAFQTAFERVQALLRNCGYVATPLAGNEIDDDVLMGKGA